MGDVRATAYGVAMTDVAADMVDWDLAISTAKRWIKPGPDVSAAEAHAVVSDLRRFANAAEEHVRSYTGLYAEPSAAAPPVMVVDRSGWVQANADAMRQVLRPLITSLRQRRGEPGPLSTAVGSRVTGVEAGGLFAFLSNKVLGQFDPFYTATGPDAVGGRLLLVAPNVVQVERELGVDPRDFRLWVCLHEETHRVQFTAVPWLRGHLLGELSGLLGSADLDPHKVVQMLRDGIHQAGRIVRGDRDVSLLDVLQTPEQRATLERLTAVMSLLEGHADVVMDGVGPEVVPSVGDIRQKFDVRRSGAGPLEQTLRRLLGFDAKLRQYRDGARFVRTVMESVGMSGLNKVWLEPDHLPSMAEITEPQRWVSRLHGVA